MTITERDIGRRYRVRCEGTDPDIYKLLRGRKMRYTLTGLHSSRIRDRKLFVTVAETRMIIAAELLEEA